MDLTHTDEDGNHRGTPPRPRGERGEYQRSHCAARLHHPSSSTMGPCPPPPSNGVMSSALSIPILIPRDTSDKDTWDGRCAPPTPCWGCCHPAMMTTLAPLLSSPCPPQRWCIVLSQHPNGASLMSLPPLDNAPAPPGHVRLPLAASLIVECDAIVEYTRDQRALLLPPNSPCQSHLRCQQHRPQVMLPPCSSNCCCCLTVAIEVNCQGSTPLPPPPWR
jgi:hypothetical protein